MTEADHKALLCPFSRDGALACVASECAVWRWADPEPAPGFVHVSGPAGVITVRKVAAEAQGWKILKDLSHEHRHGFCGAGGRP